MDTNMGDDRPLRRTPRWALGLGLLVAYAAIMVPLGFILNYANDADKRSERNTATMCEMAAVNSHLSESLDAGLQLIQVELTDTPTVDRDAAYAAMNRAVTDGRASALASAKECMKGNR